MKSYVRGYQSRKPEGSAAQNAALPNEVEVEFTRVAQWRIPAREVAGYECEILQRMRVHVGAHNCEFSIEELSSNEFAIVCLSHP
jgi:hypothetical protein